jgi:hypothetical protein
MLRARRFLGLAGWLYLAAGVAMAVASFFPPALVGALSLVLPVTGADAGAGLLLGIAGGLTAGFGATMVGVSRGPDAVLDAGARALATGVVTWFAIDSAASLGHGAWPNALANVAFLAIGLLPLAFLGPRRGGAAVDGAGAAGTASGA